MAADDSDNRSGSEGTPQGESLLADQTRLERRSKKRVPLSITLSAIGLLVLASSIGLLRSFNQSGQSTNEIQEGSDVPGERFRKPLPLVKFTDQAGKAMTLADFKGKVVLLSFWASWCSPCLVELPSFGVLYNKLHDKGLVIVPINVDEPGLETENFVKDFWKNHNFGFMTFYDREKTAVNAMQVENLPTNLLIDRKGNLVAQGTGANDWASPQAEEFITQLLGE